MDTFRGRSLKVISGPSYARASTSFLHSWERREERGSTTRPVAACGQRASGAQLLALGLAFLWGSGPLLLAHSPFSVLLDFFEGETERLGSTTPAYIG